MLCSSCGKAPASERSQASERSPCVRQKRGAQERGRMLQPKGSR